MLIRVAGSLENSGKLSFLITLSKVAGISTLIGLGSACGNVSPAQDVRLSTDWSDKRWAGYPESIGHPTSDWTNGPLHVHVIVNWNSGLEIATKTPSFILEGNNLTLCYQMHAVINSATQIPDEPGALAPVILEFVVGGIPKGNYAIHVSSRCLEADNALTAKPQ
jgi:hypothetical protein